jgi:NADH-quinone oxidoreductase subunit H
MLPLFLVVVFLGGIGLSGWSLCSTGKYVLVLVRHPDQEHEPRVKIDQAMRFFWFYCGTLVAAAVILAMVGNYYGIAWL